jgi:hypothetical protein
LGAEVGLENGDFALSEFSGLGHASVGVDAECLEVFLEAGL